MRMHGERLDLALGALFVVLVAVPAQAAERAAEPQGPALPPAAPALEHHRVMPEHLGPGIQYEQYLRDVEQRLSDIAAWVEDLRVESAAQGRPVEDRDAISGLVRAVERQLEAARGRFTRLQAADLTSRDAHRRGLNAALRELTDAYDKSRAEMWDRFGLGAKVRELLPAGAPANRGASQ